MQIEAGQVGILVVDDKWQDWEIFYRQRLKKLGTVVGISGVEELPAVLEEHFFRLAILDGLDGEYQNAVETLIDARYTLEQIIILTSSDKYIAQAHGNGLNTVLRVGDWSTAIAQAAARKLAELAKDTASD